MPRYVLTYHGDRELPPAQELRQIATVGKIVDRDVRALLLDADELDTAKLIKALPADWGIEAEHFYPVPDTREKIRKPAVE
jgi:hypothetical protein